MSVTRLAVPSQSPLVPPRFEEADSPLALSGIAPTSGGGRVPFSEISNTCTVSLFSPILDDANRQAFAMDVETKAVVVSFDWNDLERPRLPLLPRE